MMRLIASFKARFHKMRTEILVVPLLSCGIIALRFLIVNAETTRTVFNPFTGKLDFITQVSTQNFVPGSGITITCTAGSCTFNSTASSASNIAISSGSATSSVIVSSPTSNVVFDSAPFVVSLLGSTSAFITLNSSATIFHLTQKPQVVISSGLFQTTSTSFVTLGSTFSITMTPTSANSCFLVRMGGVTNEGTIGKNDYLTVFDNSVNICPTDHCVEAYPGNSGTQLPIINNFNLLISTCPNSTSAQTFVLEGRVDSGGTLTIGDNGGMAQTYEVDNVQ